MSREETQQLERDGHVEIGTGLTLPSAESPAMALWVSRGLNWIAGRADLPFPNDIPMATEHGTVGYRRLDAEWLTWLRQNCRKNRDARSVVAVQEKMLALSDAIAKHMPQLANADAAITKDYEPPLLDAVSWARS